MKQRIDPFAPRATKAVPIPFAFVLDALAPRAPRTRPMFGCTAVYLEERIVFVLRQKQGSDDGIWLAFEPEMEAAVLALFPALETIEVIGTSHGWRKLSPRSASFEDDALHACRLLCDGDTRLGKVPKARRPRATKRAKRAR